MDHHGGHGGGHDPLDRRVALSIAIIAALHAATAMLSHRGHTETLRLQTVANSEHTRESDQWAYYQAKNIRQHFYETMTEIAAGKDTPEAKVRERWAKQIAKYAVDLPKHESDARDLHEAAKKNMEASHQMHAKCDRYDVGELFLEVGMILCSICLLTRQKSYFLFGMLACATGVAVALTGVFGLFLGGASH